MSTFACGDGLTPCGLCQTPTPAERLRKSHLIPSALYKLAREEDRDPVVMAASGASPTSKHIRAPFLCDDCEDRFSKNGETHVMGHCLRSPDQFLLRDQLLSLMPAVTEVAPGVDVYRVPPEVYPEKYLYFAASVFWRAAARTWRWRGKDNLRIRLGPYEKPLRLYLLGQTEFPPDMAMFLFVARENDLAAVTTTPYSFRNDTGRAHRFAIPGITFMLQVGGRAGIMRDGFLNGSAPCMWVDPFRDTARFKSIMRFVGRVWSKAGT